MEKVEMRGKEVRKCQWEETVWCPRLVGQFSNAGVGDDSVTFQSNFGDSKPGQLDSLVMPVLAMFLAMAKAIVMSIVTICVGDCDGHELENNPGSFGWTWTGSRPIRSRYWTLAKAN